MPDDTFDEVAREIVNELLGEPCCEHEIAGTSWEAEHIAAILRREFAVAESGKSWRQLAEERWGIIEQEDQQYAEVQHKLNKAREALKQALRHLPWGARCHKLLLDTLKETRDE